MVTSPRSSSEASPVQHASAVLGWYPQRKRLGEDSQLTVGTVLEGGNTVMVIEHNLDVISGADLIVDMGLRAGKTAAG
jgi:hypothetical protein